MHNQRYSVKREQDGTWTVFDVFTGEPAVIGPDKLSSQLSPEEADEVVGLLNLLDAIRRNILEEPLRRSIRGEALACSRAGPCGWPSTGARLFEDYENSDLVERAARDLVVSFR